MGRDHDESVPFSRVFDLPSEVGLRIAAATLGLSLTTAYRRAQRGEFPCPLRRVGRTYVVRLRDLMRAAGIQDVRVHYDDLEAGARFAAGETDA
ncbi:hypothetical protein GA0115239_104831 [Streptomyces sp. BpilaLS-43]|uniref:helix-turn-helix transcriptional regulator n=1 Tax=Streptomyces sp. BpilaLS-43 TaxID=1839778 RepID=UPI00081AFD85|nr:helix-turn-helix domain-containing protein [Streptomyces sp. BpilaLS-43]SCD64106.1 hypothetical protein GA0115239_104831 [Streptomyces sp. BpilaLS-43]